MSLNIYHLCKTDFTAYKVKSHQRNKTEPDLYKEPEYLTNPFIICQLYICIPSDFLFIFFTRPPTYTQVRPHVL